MSFGDDLCERTGCFGIGTWLESLLVRLGQPFPEALQPGEEMRTGHHMGYVLTLGRVSAQLPDPRDEFVLLRAEGDTAAAMPFLLDARFETMDSAAQKLSHDMAGGSTSEIEAGDRRVSYFLDGGAIVELRFNASLQGFDRILLARLGVSRNWRG